MNGIIQIYRKMFKFTNFSLTGIMLFMLLFVGVIFLLSLLYAISFVHCIFVFFLCPCSASVIDLVSVMPAYKY